MRSSNKTRSARSETRGATPGRISLLALRSSLLVFLLLLTGCQSAQVAEPLTATLAGGDDDSQLAFWHTLAERNVTSNDEAMHALLLFVDGKDDSADYAGRVQTLKSRGILSGKFDAPANQAVTRGDLAVALVHILQVKGGVVMRAFGASPRYATRELEYLGIYPEGSDQQTFRGNEFLFIIGRAEDHQRRAKIRAPAEQLPDEAGKAGGA